MQDKIELYVNFQFRIGTESEMHKIQYNHTHTWARDLPACTAEHFFKKMLRFLYPESVLGTTTGIFQWISKVYENFLLEGMQELTKFNNIPINTHHPALIAFRSFFTDCERKRGPPGFPVWEEPAATPAAPGQDDPGAATQDAPVEIPQDPGSIASAAPDQETMVQVLADQKNIDRNEGDNETTLQAEAARIRADLARTCGHLDASDIGSTECTGFPGDRLSLTEIAGIGRS
eukprot:1285864-Pyramimonas_sp.AAC.1